MQWYVPFGKLANVALASTLGLRRYLYKYIAMRPWPARGQGAADAMRCPSLDFQLVPSHGDLARGSMEAANQF